MRRWVAGVCLVLAASGLAGCSTAHVAHGPGSTTTTRPALVAGSSGTATSGDQVTVLCSSDSSPFALLAVTRPSGAVALELTRGFRRFVDVTPGSGVVPSPSFGPSVGAFTAGACPTPTDFWVVAASTDHSVGWLLHSVNAGQSWTAARQAWAGPAGGASVAFSDARHGFIVSGDPAANGNAGPAFARTTDGGATWTNVAVPITTLDALMGGSELMGGMVFMTGTDGFAASLSPRPPFSTVDSTLLTTSDAGSTWTTATLPVPAGPTATQPVPDGPTTLFGTPRAFGGQAILPVIAIRPALSVPGPGQTERGVADVIVDQTSDGGSTWRSWPVVTLGAPVDMKSQTGSIPWGTPSVSPSDPSTVWIAYVMASGHIALRFTTDSGRSWSTPLGAGLPSAAPGGSSAGGSALPVSVQAVSASDAIVTVETQPSPSSPADGVSYLTRDGGRQWSLLTNAVLGG